MTELAGFRILLLCIQRERERFSNPGLGGLDCDVDSYFSYYILVMISDDNNP